MFCPNCGAKNNKQQNYCRFCGLYLREMSRALISQLVFGEDSKPVKSLGSIKRVLDLAAAVTAGVVIACAVGLFFFGWSMGKDVLKMGAIIFFLLESIVGAIGYYQRRARSKARAVRDEQTETGRLEPGEPVKFLEERPFEPAPTSVSENSTELLPLENRTRKLD